MPAAPESNLSAREPGLLTVLAGMLKCSFKGALIGSVLGAAVMGITSFLCGLFGASVPGATLFYSGGGASLLNGAALGAILGSALGVPCGCAQGVGEIRSYYRNIAIPEIKQEELAPGKHVSAQLGQVTPERELMAAQFPTEITSISGNQNTLEHMVPMGRA